MSDWTTRTITREEQDELVDKAQKTELQRVLEMIRKISKEYPIGKLYFEWLVLELKSRSPNEII